MSNLTEDTDVAQIEHTDALDPVVVTEPTSTDTDTSSGKPPVVQPITDDEALARARKLSRTEDKPSRTKKTIEKVVSIYNDAINDDGEIELESISKNFIDNKIGNEALKAFAEKNNIDFKSLRKDVLSFEETTQIGQLKKQVDELSKQVVQTKTRTEEDEFVDFYSKTVGSLNLTPSEFAEKYQDSFEEVFLKNSNRLSKIDAAEVAFDLVKKQIELEKKYTLQQKKEDILANSVTLPSSTPKELKKNEYLTREDVADLPEAKRIEYKQKHFTIVQGRRVPTYKE